MNSLKELSIWAVTLLLALPLTAQNKGINFFEGSWAEAKAKAELENKPIMLDGYASWCGPCKWMFNNIMPQQRVGKFFNDNFINVKIDMEKGEGPMLDSLYSVDSYPTFLFFNPKGELVHKFLGSRDAKEFVVSSKRALNEDTQLYSLEKKYKEGDRSAKLLKNYALALEDAGGYISDITEVSNKYIEMLKADELLAQSNMDFMMKTAYDHRSLAYKNLMNEKEEFVDVFTRKKVHETLYRVAKTAVDDAVAKKDENLFKEVTNQMSESLPKHSDKMNAQLGMHYYQGVENWDKYAEIATAFGAEHGQNNWQLLNQIAWTMFEQVDDKALLAKGLELADRSIELDKNYYNTDTKAALHFKLGQKKHAIKAAKEAISIAKANEMDPSETEALLKKIKGEK